MARPGRTVATVAALLSMIVVAGCAGGSASSASPTPEPTTISPSPAAGSATPTATSTGGYQSPGGWVDAAVVERAPEDATVLPANGSAIEDVEPVQEAVRRAYPKGSAEVHRDRSELEEVEEVMPRSAFHEGEDSGWYVSYHEAVVRIRFVHYV